MTSATAWSAAYEVPVANKDELPAGDGSEEYQTECFARFEPVMILASDVNLDGFSAWQKLKAAVAEWFKGFAGGLASEFPTGELEGAFASLLNPQTLGSANSAFVGLQLVPLALIPTAGDVLGVTGRLQAMPVDDAVLLGSDASPFAQTITLDNVARGPIPIKTPGWPEGLANPWTSLSPFPGTAAELSQLSAADLTVHLDQMFGPIDPPFNIVPVANSEREGRALPTRAWAWLRYGEQSSGWSDQVWSGLAVEATDTWMLDSGLVGLPLPDMGSVSSLHFDGLDIPTFGDPALQTIVAALAQSAALWQSIWIADVPSAFAAALAEAKAAGPGGIDLTRGRLTVRWAYRSSALEMLTQVTAQDEFITLSGFPDEASVALVASLNAAIDSAPSGFYAMHDGWSHIPLDFVSLVEQAGTEMPRNTLPPWWPVPDRWRMLAEWANIRGVDPRWIGLLKPDRNKS